MRSKEHQVQRRLPSVLALCALHASARPHARSSLLARGLKLQRSALLSSLVACAAILVILMASSCEGSSLEEPVSSCHHGGECQDASACEPGESLCASGCVDTQTSAQHCGGCGQTCPAGSQCAAGSCDLTCTGGTTRCGDQCVDLRWDPGNCGGCAQVCGSGEVCSQAQCSLECGGKTSKCGDRCVDLAHDPGHCGACDSPCPAGQTCGNGVCVIACLGGTTLCGTKCVDLENDPAHCGNCHGVCSDQGTCSNGVCSTTLICTGGGVACGSKCVDLTSDEKNCGKCGVVCPQDRVCKAGSCECALGQVCSGSCVDTQTSASHCGVCGAACDENQICSTGKCKCAPGAVVCSGDCVFTSISFDNCGACGKQCKGGEVCTGGNCAAPTSHWQMFGYDARHSGFNSVEASKPPLELSWSTQLGGASPNPLVVDAGRVFLSLNHDPTTRALIALRLSDGVESWSYKFDSAWQVGHPAAVDGRVFLLRSDTTGTKLFSFDGKTGTATWSATVAAQSQTHWSPIVVSNSVYLHAAGSSGGLYAFDVTTAIQSFSVALQSHAGWSPAFNSGALHTFVNGVHRAIDPANGTELWKLDVASAGTGNKSTTPTIDGKLAFVIVPPDLHAIDISTKSPAWKKNGNYEGQVAVAGGVVYALSSGSLIARSAASGQLLWTFAGDGNLKYPPVVAGGTVYAASDDNVYALDAATHKAVWSAKFGGWLAVASGRLVVASQNGEVRAYLLKG